MHLLGIQFHFSHSIPITRQEIMTMQQRRIRYEITSSAFSSGPAFQGSRGGILKLETNTRLCPRSLVYWSNQVKSHRLLYVRQSHISPCVLGAYTMIFTHLRTVYC
ncbi:hypothetical protein GE21DRAFT_1354246 [Neurospora crassa]|nr:hypothetical protein B1D1.30 [imported] - Neurospora crassa [Neurospora crassa]KHE82663.1 hypothetical protein GE21DRAFT_1354246 [Neurospora crassa]